MKNKIGILFLIISGLFFYTFTVRGVIGNFSQNTDYAKMNYDSSPFESSHERSPFMELVSIVQYHQLALTRPEADFAVPDVGYFKSKFYSFFPPGVATAIIPLYILGSRYNLGLVFAYFTMCIFGILSMIFLFKIAREILKLPLWASLFSIFVFTFGCTSWSYSITIYEHAISTFFAILIFYSAWRYKQNTKFSWIWASIIWIVYALSLFVDYPNAILFLPLMVYFLISSINITETIQGYRIKFRKTIFITFIFFILISGAHLYYNQVNFGNWKTFSNSFPLYDGGNFDQLQNQDTVAITTKKQEVASIFTEKNLPFGAYELSIADDKGLLFFSPIFILAIFACFSIRKKMNIEIKTIMIFCAVNFILYASFGDPWGGYAFGPRYLIPSMAFLSLLVGIWVSTKNRELPKKIIAYILFLFSSAIALLGAITTNMVHQKAHALQYGLKYNFTYNIDFLFKNLSGSFVYNTYFSHTITLATYFLILYISLIILTAAILFILPRFETGHHD